MESFDNMVKLFRADLLDQEQQQYKCDVGLSIFSTPNTNNSNPSTTISETL